MKEERKSNIVSYLPDECFFFFRKSKNNGRGCRNYSAP